MPKLSDYIRATIELGGVTDPTVTENEAMARAEQMAADRERGPNLPIGARGPGDWTCHRGHRQSGDTMIYLACLF